MPLIVDASGRKMSGRKAQGSFYFELMWPCCMFLDYVFDVSHH